MGCLPDADLNNTTLDGYDFEAYPKFWEYNRLFCFAV